ncbi:YrrS family protein [Anaerobacillus isosaccharinicus]|uniref:YrrS family protein n=1 Tax=Anaerobacillus isosaccharinicus TaxID=1532552 RepID=A0A1S2LSH5_9BACI|nr:YrrS family protein [Anaerobacillus isosaccharinicus]MBA5585405.1 YrrS family protein [Anaerobacillus isosaccharinicus]QOY36276.1 YrrS family protein [Anaerobacillus isosaccharinicus]
MSDDHDFYGSGVRSHKRKRKKADKILNISIGVVLFLILLVGGQLLLGGKSTEKVVSDQIDEQGEFEHEDLNEEALEEIEEAKPEEPLEKEKTTTEPSSTPTEQQKPKDPPATSEQVTSSPQMGQWKPIGTVQQEPFVAVFERDHVNWEEMRRAFQVATGLGDDLTLWRVGNGGNHQSAVGVVADASTRSTPYQVRLEWVTNEGWMPVSVEQLDSNPHDRSAAESTTNSTNESTDNN